jgi:hypothetical protein
MLFILNIIYIYSLSIFFASAIYINFLTEFTNLDSLNLFAILLTTGILLIPQKKYKWEL